ncbi:PhoD-like phosphatase N-terminal domain-containing protein, partial [Streptomyces scopuliridis]
MSHNPGNTSSASSSSPAADVPKAPARRSVLRGSLAASAVLALPGAALAGAAPAQALPGRPRAAWGVQAGDVTSSSGLVWVRSDRPARMIVETSATESFRRARSWHGPLLGPGTDFTGTVPLRGLPAGEQVHYRVTLADPEDPRRTGEP